MKNNSQNGNSKYGKYKVGESTVDRWDQSSLETADEKVLEKRLHQLKLQLQIAQDDGKYSRNSVMTENVRKHRPIDKVNIVSSSDSSSESSSSDSTSPEVRYASYRKRQASTDSDNERGRDVYRTHGKEYRKIIEKPGSKDIPAQYVSQSSRLPPVPPAPLIKSKSKHSTYTHLSVPNTTEDLRKVLHGNNKSTRYDNTREVIKYGVTGKHILRSREEPRSPAISSHSREYDDRSPRKDIKDAVYRREVDDRLHSKSLTVDDYRQREYSVRSSHKEINDHGRHRDSEDLANRRDYHSHLKGHEDHLHRRTRGSDANLSLSGDERTSERHSSRDLKRSDHSLLIVTKTDPSYSKKLKKDKYAEVEKYQESPESSKEKEREAYYRLKRSTDYEKQYSRNDELKDCKSRRYDIIINSRERLQSSDKERVRSRSPIHSKPVSIRFERSPERDRYPVRERSRVYIEKERDARNVSSRDRDYVKEKLRETEYIDNKSKERLKDVEFIKDRTRDIAFVPHKSRDEYVKNKVTAPDINRDRLRDPSDRFNDSEYMNHVSRDEVMKHRSKVMNKLIVQDSGGMHFEVENHLNIDRHRIDNREQNMKKTLMERMVSTSRPSHIRDYYLHDIRKMLRDTRPLDVIQNRLDIDHRIKPQLLVNQVLNHQDHRSSADRNIIIQRQMPPKDFRFDDRNRFIHESLPYNNVDKSHKHSLKITEKDNEKERKIHSRSEIITKNMTSLDSANKKRISPGRTGLDSTKEKRISPGRLGKNDDKPSSSKQTLVTGVPDDVDTELSDITDVSDDDDNLNNEEKSEKEPEPVVENEVEELDISASEQKLSQKSEEASIDYNEFSVIDELTVDLQQKDENIEDIEHSDYESSTTDETELFTVSRISDVLGVDWECLVADSKRSPSCLIDSTFRNRWEASSILSQIGISRKYAGKEVFEEIDQELSSVNDTLKDSDQSNQHRKYLLHDVAGIHACLKERNLRRNLLFEPYKTAISVKRDIEIRRQLLGLPIEDLKLQLPLQTTD